MENNQFAPRRELVAAGLAGRKLDALLVAFSPNLRYLSGFTGSNAALLIRPGRSVLFTDPRYQIQAAQECSCKVQIVKGPLVMSVLADLQKSGVHRIGYEPARMTCDFYDSLHSRLPLHASLEPVHGWIEELRMIKSAEEIARIRQSVLTNSQAFTQTLRHVKAGMKESDLAAELEYRMRRLGAEKPAFETIVASGARSALPHAQPTRNKLTPGDLVVVDMGAFENGYASDMTRMLSVGPPSAKVKRMYRAVLDAQLAGVAAVRPGVTAVRVDAVTRGVLKSHGLDKAFTHSTGHGLGLEIHEPPRLGKRDKTRLQPGMLVTIEPGVYIEGFGGIRIEDTVLVTEEGCEVLTPTPKDLVEVVGGLWIGALDRKFEMQVEPCNRCLVASTAEGSSRPDGSGNGGLPSSSSRRRCPGGTFESMRRSSVTLRLQPSILEEARRIAEAEGVALNQFINVAAGEGGLALRTEEYLGERGARGDVAKAKRVLKRAGRGNTPSPGDEQD